MKSILIVCQGNICRSPMAEAFFFHELHKCRASIVVSSAGISAVVGHPPTSEALSVMSQNGIDISKHRGSQINEGIVRQNDLILVMTLNQRITVERQYPTAKGKIYLLGQWSGFEIDDPLGKPIAAFEKVYKQIKHAWLEWQTRIIECATV